MRGETDGERGRTAGIVLAGGRSSRLAAGGIDPPGGKASLLLGGIPLLARVVAAVGAVATRTVVVAAPGQPLPALPAGVGVIRDSRPGSGPLAALADGLAALAPVPPVERVVVVSCDVPLVAPPLLRLLLDRLGEEPGARWWVVPEVGGHLQVLLSVLRPALAPAIDDWLAAGRRDPRSLVERLRAESPGRVEIVPEAVLRRADPDLSGFRDLDTAADLDALRRTLEAGGES